MLVVPLDEEPGILARSLAPIEPDQVEAPVQPGAVQDELQVALAHGGRGIADRLPGAAWSQVSTSPAPYWPSGMLPWKSA